MSDTVNRRDVIAEIRRVPMGDVLRGEILMGRINALPPAHEWQPIETAPKDGTPVMLWSIECCSELHQARLCKGPVIANWRDGKSDVAGDDWWEEQGGVAYVAWVRASHWMPLPPPPAD